MEQNKVTPMLTKELMIWTFSEELSIVPIHVTTTYLFFLFERDHRGVPYGSRIVARSGELACQPSTYVLPDMRAGSPP